MVRASRWPTAALATLTLTKATFAVKLLGLAGLYVAARQPLHNPPMLGGRE